MGSPASIGLYYICYSYDWVARFYWLESNSYIIELYSIDAYIEHGNEYSSYSKVFTIKKR